MSQCKKGSLSLGRGQFHGSQNPEMEATLLECFTKTLWAILIKVECFG